MTLVSSHESHNADDFSGDFQMVGDNGLHRIVLRLQAVDTFFLKITFTGGAVINDCNDQVTVSGSMSGFCN